MHAVRFGGSITDDVEAKLSFGGFGTHIHFAYWWTIALGKQFEVVDESLHAAGDLPLGRWYNLGVADAVRPRRQTFESLIDNMQALLHFQHSYQVAIVHIAIRAHGDIELELFVATIWKCFA